MRLLFAARRWSALFLGVSLVCCIVLLAGNRSKDAAPPQRSSIDVALPLEVRLLPLGEPRPGAALRVRVEVEAFRDFADADLVILAPSDVSLLSASRRSLGKLNARKPLGDEFTVVVPPHGERRTVDVRVRAVVDDGPVMEQGTTLNLSFAEEPSRVVTDANGVQVREVLARRVP